MATKSLLTPEECEEWLHRLVAPERLPKGNQKHPGEFPNRDFSLWLGRQLEEKLAVDPLWERSVPVGLGSLARGELCPRSDIDLLFCGPEKVVGKMVRRLNEKGYKVRYRVPEDPSDWTVGVGPVDWVAILHGHAFSSPAAARLQEQQELLRAKGRTVARKISTALQLEKRERNARYDSISNFLEPNLKYGAGGLRDLQQALYLGELFPEKFLEDRHAFEVLQYYRDFFLTIRQKLHLLGGADVLVSQFQGDIATWFGYKSHLDFMREVQRGLSRVSFYSDWVFERAKATKAVLEEVEGRLLSSLHDCFSALRENPSVLMQYRVRNRQDRIFKTHPASERQIGRWLNRYIRPGVEDRFVLALFRSRLIDKCLPNLRKLVGLVQHNQYHRYTADTHILQALRILLRFHQTPKKWPELRPLLSRMKNFDWQVLVWTCLYHDIGKGRGGDHSILGARLAEKDLEKMGLSRKLIDEVVWMVKNHLLLSLSAFRKNPRSKDTWRELYDKGVVGARLHRLAFFTIVDIQATNPDAWNDWKQQLLLGLVQSMEDPEASKLMSFLRTARNKGIEVHPEFLEELDSFVLQGVPSRILLEEAVEIELATQSMPPRVFGSESEKWVRFHEKDDRPGLFVDFVQRLRATGVSIRQASIRTFPRWGAYDWFLVKTSKSNAQLRRLLKHASVKKEKKAAKFEAIQIISEDEKELVLSFRGRDRAGALGAAAQGLHDLGLQVRWAVVHTWGRMLDDVFGVEAPENSTEVLNQLQERLVPPRAER